MVRNPISQHVLRDAKSELSCSQFVASERSVLLRAEPTPSGLVKQIDDQLGRLFEYLESSGRMRDTLIVVTSDHGNSAGDHWLGEKEIFHETSVRVPLIVYDQDGASDHRVAKFGDNFTSSCWTF
jgi:membrane-anchored protein YejM (alkaline phosphatase superfamily)